MDPTARQPPRGRYGNVRESARRIITTFDDQGSPEILHEALAESNPKVDLRRPLEGPPPTS